MIRASETTTALLKAMVEAAPEITAIPKTKQSNGQKFSYKYATLDGLIDMLRQVLPKHGLWFMQMPTTCEDSIELITRVFHTSGEWIEESISFGKTELQGGGNDTQKMGASITYFRRYALASVFGVAADEDTDGQAPQRPNNYQSQKQITHNQNVPAQSKRDPVPFIMGVVGRRMKEGETKHSILREFADILKLEVAVDVKDMTADELTALARELYVRDMKNMVKEV